MNRSRTLEYGFNYLPTVDHIEHFAPFWVQDKLNIEQMRRDLLTMRNLGSRFVRIHLFPANATRDSHPCVDQKTSPRLMLDAAAFANRIGLNVHLDIWSPNILNITPDEVRSVVAASKKFTQSYQIGNESYFNWAKSDDYYHHLHELIKAGKSVFPAAKFSADILPPQLKDIRRRFPDLYALMDMIMIHYYAASDHRGWRPVYIEQLVHYTGSDDNRFAELRDERFVQSEFYPDRYDLTDKEKWIPEITACGYHKYANTMDDDIKAANWREVCHALQTRTDVVRVGHHCFNDKFSWREYGSSQCGMVWKDGTPKASGIVFREMAFATMPEDDLARHVEIRLEVRNGSLEVELTNRLPRALEGSLSFETSPEIAFEGADATVSIPANGHMQRQCKWTLRAPARSAALHFFAYFRCEAWENLHRTVVGWNIFRQEQPIAVNTSFKPFDNLRYVGGVETVRKFFQKYPTPAIVVDGVVGSDCELGYRLMSVLRALTGKPITLSAVVDARDLLDQPLIILGNPRTNYLANLVEAAAMPEARLSPDNRSFLAVVEKPFQYETRNSPNAMLIGFCYCPVCLYIAGASNEDLRRAAYDLIRRLWLDENVRVTPEKSCVDSLVAKDSRRFRIDLGPGPYRVTAQMGSADSNAKNSTCFVLQDGMRHGPFETRGQSREATFPAYVEQDHLLLEIRSEAGGQWSLAELEVAHAGLLADYHLFVFPAEAARPRLTKDAQWYTEMHVARKLPVWDDTHYTHKSGYGWVKA